MEVSHADIWTQEVLLLIEKYLDRGETLVHPSAQFQSFSESVARLAKTQRQAS
jgi:hypothetical protein